MGFYGFLFIMLLLRGPHCQRFTWLGYEGGLDARKSVVEARKKAESDMAQLPAGSDSEKDLESGVVGDGSEHDDEKTADNGHSTLHAPDHLTGGVGMDVERNASSLGEELPPKDGMPPMAADGSPFSDDAHHKLEHLN
jgi:hypothetical protein